MKKSILITLFTFISFIANAADVIYNGIYYSIQNIDGQVVAVVTYPDVGYRYSHYYYYGNVIIPDSVGEVGRKYPVYGINSYTFYDCESLISVTLPNTLIRIRDNAFYGCKGLTSIIIPYSVKSIASNAFYYCENLLDITCLAITPPMMSDYLCLFPAYYMATLHVPERSEEAYRAYDWWNCFMSIVGDAEDHSPVTYQTDNCDTNGDGEVNIADVNKIIDAILSK